MLNWVETRALRWPLSNVNYVTSEPRNHFARCANTKVICWQNFQSSFT